MEFQDTMPLDGPGAQPLARHTAPMPLQPLAPAAAPAATAAAPLEQVLSIRFTGSGSEYFRIWIVNLLLMLVTLGFYYPFAKARRLRYFHANTVIGEHALGFHGDPMKMLRGYLLMLVFGICYGGAGYFSPMAAAVAALLLAALWPALWRASLRFRLANTSWRGLRLRFTGGTAEAYRALLPLLLPGAVFVALSASQRGAQPDKLSQPAMLAAGITLLVSGLTLMLLWPLGLAWIKRYQHSHYRFAGETSALSARTSAFYGVWLVMILISLLPLGLMIVLVVVGSFGMIASGGKAIWPLVLMGLGMAGFYLSLFFISQPYFTAKIQNLVWSATRSTHLRFDSQLRFRPLGWLTFKNFLLMLLTLGLYRPFAAIHTARLRLEAVQLFTHGDIGQWSAAGAGRFDDAAGDAAGDLLGIDIGL